MTELDIFATAVELATPEERARYLAETCGSDTTLRARIEALLRSSEKAASFLEMPPSAVATSVEELRAAAPERTSLGFLNPSDKPGSLGRLDHYEILEVVGTGGMGIVLKARDEKLQRVVAIKMMAEALAASPAARRRFVGEAQAAAAIRDDHVVSIYAVEDSGPIPYLVMELISGVSLQQRLEQTGPLEMREICRIGMQIAHGLAAAHAQGVIHRDIKPANILLENGVGRVKITDFGLARVADDASSSQSGLIAGTPQYMSPEQARGEIIDPRTDLFSLGSTLYAICTGRAPFRASSTMAVLKRVCEDRASPIREANPSIPQWLVDLIDKLQAKEPAERLQSAGEVAEQLRQYLAGRLDTAELPAMSTPPQTAADQRPRWALAAAAAVLLCLAGGLSLTEATGVTSLRATVIHIFTPDGTLVVETDDPAVKVTVEGDGGLVITGAGLEEIRLRPGSYRVHADKEGRPIPLDKDLVTVTRGGRAIVKVKLESSSSPAAAKAEKGAFVLLGGDGVAQRKFDTLTDAVSRSSAGDTIEIRGNGPFVTDHIEFKYALTIRAGTGFRPVLTAAPQEELPWGNLLISHGPLRLEGLEIRCTSKAYRILHANGPVRVANCRFQFVTEGNVCIEGFAGCVVRNCEMLSPPGAALAFRCHSDSDSDVLNCLLVGHVNLEEFDSTRGATLRFSRNTFVSPHNSTFLHCLHPQQMPLEPLRDLPGKRVQLSVAESVIDTSHGLFSLVQPKELKPQFDAVGVETWVPRRVKWSEERNLYRPVPPYIRCQVFLEGEVPLTRRKDLADWNRFWGLKNTASSEGVIRFHGGDLLDKARTNHPKLTPDDFRLRADSAGYRAGKDGKDLGADVDLVGPGAAYERWKKTPEYQEWLKETGQVR